MTETRAFEMSSLDVPAESVCFVDVSPTRVLWGINAVDGLAPALPDSTAERWLIVTGRSLAGDSALISRIESALPGRSLTFVFDATEEHVPSTSIVAGARRAREIDAQGVIALGGGTAIDSARLIALAIGCDLTARLEGVDASRASDILVEAAKDSDGDAWPEVVTISTTLSGAEWTPYAGVTDPVRRFKHVTRHSGYRASLAVLDAGVACNTPIRLWLSSGVRALDHAVETMYSKANHPLVELVAARALQLLPDALRGSLAEPQDPEFRARAQLGSWFSFFSIDTVMIGPSHALSHQIGTLSGVPHGITSCVLLPTVMGFLRQRSPERHRLIADALGATETGDSAAAAGERAERCIRQLIADLGLPMRLRDVGVAREDLPEAAERATKETIGMLAAPGVELRQADLLSILERAY